ncbi:alpha/beta hydrolase [candidate division KSB1 bacterium]|nr:alpha/beta hydrolase [candidate division KSB1 bacterium]
MYCAVPKSWPERCSGTPIDPVGFAKPYLITLARLLSRIWPGCPIKIPFDAATISRDADVVAAYQQDSLVHCFATPRWGTESQKTIQWIKSRPQDLQMPILMIHGGSDPINTVTGCEDFFEKVTYPDKQLLVYPESYHEPHNDLDHKQVVEDLEKWLTKHL